VIAVLVDPGAPVVEGVVELDPAERHHLEVRRARNGEEVRVLDGEGWSAMGTLDVERKAARVRIERTQRVEPPLPLVLAVGAGDRDRFTWLVEKAAELGVTRLIPLTSDHAGGVATRLRAAQLARLRRRAREAIKQSLLPWAPVVDQEATVADLCRRPPAGTRWLASREGGLAPARLPQEPVLIAVGPEGGFTATEDSTLRQAGFQAISLGPGILRFETAAIAAAAQALTARLRGQQ
jgi:16S rRNA (uracil1498-N3)-methyltransferase